MRILFAIKNLNHPGGGAERVLTQVANGLSDRRHDVHVQTFDAPGGTSFYPLNPGIRRIDLGTCPGGGRLGPRGMIRSLPLIRRRIAGLAPDIVIAFMHPAFVPTALALVRTGIPLIFSEHTGLAHYRTRPVQRLLLRAAEQAMCAKTVPSAVVRDEFGEAARSRIEVIPNPQEPSALAGIPDCAPARPLRLLAVGTFRGEKNYPELVRAFAQVAPRFPDWVLRIVGDGPERARIEAEIDRSGMAERITLTGMVRDVRAEYAGASIVAIPSHYESFGLVAVEALAAARPVISFVHCIGVAEIIRDGENGLLVEGGSTSAARVASFADGLARLMADAELRAALGRAGPSSITRFNLDGVLDIWEALLHRVTADAGSLQRPRPVRDGSG